MIYIRVTTGDTIANECFTKLHVVFMIKGIIRVKLYGGNVHSLHDLMQNPMIKPMLLLTGGGSLGSGACSVH